MKDEPFNLSIKFPVNPGLAVYANNATLQLDASGGVYLTFFQVCPPIVVATTPDELKEKIEQTGAIEAMPVARIAMSSIDAKKILKLLKSHLEGSENE